MTAEEKQQVQNIISARTKLLSEKISKQEAELDSLYEEISTLNEEIENQNKEIDSLKTKLSDAQKQNKKLTELIEDLQPKPKEEKQEIQEKPSYLVSLLRQHFGFDSFKNGQEEIINAVLSGRDVFCSMPEDYGKSIAYRLSALLMPGITIVITQSKPDENILDSHSEYIEENISSGRKRELLRRLKNNSCRILYSDIDSLNDNDIKTSLKSIEISMLVILAEWGNFNPEKLNGLRDFAASLTPRKITTGVFADSTSPTMRKTLIQLADLRSPLTVIKGFCSSDITFKIINTDEKNKTLNEILSSRNHSEGVIFCDTPETVNKIRSIAAKIPDKKLMILPENSYREIKGKNLSFIIHYDVPESLGSYSQIINAVDKNSKLECIVLSSRKYLRLSERAVIQFCKDKEPKNILLSYLGQEISENEVNDEEKILPEDFNFGTSNEAQKEAVTRTENPILILGGAGTGKTYTLIQRTVFLIQKGKADPKNIFIASFNKKSAEDFKVKLRDEFISRKINADINEIKIGMFHSLCAEILREFAKLDFDVADEFENAFMIFKNLDKFGNIPEIKTRDKWNFSCELADYINKLTEELIDTEELIKDENISVKSLGRAIKIHDKLMLENGILTPSAILSKTYKLLRNNPEILDSVHDKIRYIMIDDYHKINYVQEQIAFMLTEQNKNICVAGNENFSRRIAEFPDKFNKNECKTIKLILNYRSEQGIIKFFGEWIKTKQKVEAFRISQNNYPSVMRLAGMDDKDEWHEKIADFVKELKLSGKISDYNQIVFLFSSLKNKNVKELSKFLENNNINVWTSETFPERNEIYFAMGCLISIFPRYIKSLKAGEFNVNGKDPDYIVLYKNCLRYLSGFLEGQNCEKLKKWLIERRNYSENYTFSDLIYNLFEFYPLNSAIEDYKKAESFSKLIKILKNYENSFGIKSVDEDNFKILMNIYFRYIFNKEEEYSKIPAGHVGFMTFDNVEGMEFPIVFVDSLDSVYENEPENILDRIAKNYSRNSENIKKTDLRELFYVGFSRAKDILILTCNEDRRTPGKFIEDSYNKLNDAEEFTFLPNPPEQNKTHELKRILTFEGDILTYEICPTQYKFYRELEFNSEISQESNFFSAGTEINLVRDDYVIKGKIDSISVQDGKAEITSIKEGTKPNININSDRNRLENYIRELNLYAYSVEQTFGLKVENIKIHYSGENENNSEVVYKYDDNKAGEVIKNIDDIAEKIIKRDFDLKTSDSENCKDCNFKFFCGRKT
ncbi:MAG: UvrD-helicase domain-containing protein [Synergistaceae bacterium]|nr:UvrD-helicase domain-containing protein [Synergistaceae bacterium]